MATEIKIGLNPLRPHIACIRCIQYRKRWSYITPSTQMSLSTDQFQIILDYKSTSHTREADDKRVSEAKETMRLAITIDKKNKVWSKKVWPSTRKKSFSFSCLPNRDQTLILFSHPSFFFPLYQVRERVRGESRIRYFLSGSNWIDQVVKTGLMDEAMKWGWESEKDAKMMRGWGGKRKTRIIASFVCSL